MGPDVLVKVNPHYFRPTEVDLLWGQPAKAKAELGWKLKVDFEVLSFFLFFGVFSLSLFLDLYLSDFLFQVSSKEPLTDQMCFLCRTW